MLFDRLFRRYPTTTIAFEMSRELCLDTLDRCLAYGGHDTYREGRAVLFDTKAGAQAFLLGFEDLVVDAGMREPPKPRQMTVEDQIHQNCEEAFRALRK